MSIKQKILKNTIISGVAHVYISIIGLLLLPFMINRLGAVEYGLIGFIRVFSVLGIMGVFDFGLRMVITKFVAQYKAENKEYYILTIISSSSIFLLLVGSLLSAIGMFISGHVASFLSVPDIYKENFKLALKVVFVSYVFELPGIIFAGAIEGFQRFDYLKSTEVIRFSLYAIFSVMLILSGYGFLEIVISATLLSFGQVLVYGYLTKKCVGKISRHSKFFSLTALRECFKLSRHLFSAQVSSVLGNNAEKVLITVMLNPVYMTMYEIIVKLPRFIKSSISFLGAAIMPAASELAARQDTDRNRQLFVQGLRLNQMAGYPIVICILFLAKDFIEAWVGSEYASLVILLQMLLMVNLLSPVANFGWKIMLGMNRKVPYISYLQWINTLIKFGVLLLLLPTIKLWAVVLASLSIVTTLPVSVTIFCRELNVRYRTLLVESVLIIVISALPAMFVPGLREFIGMDNVLQLVAVVSVWLAVVWPLFYCFVMDKASKQIVKSLLGAFLEAPKKVIQP